MYTILYIYIVLDVYKSIYLYCSLSIKFYLFVNPVQEKRRIKKRSTRSTERGNTEIAENGEKFPQVSIHHFMIAEIMILRPGLLRDTEVRVNKSKLNCRRAKGRCP